MPSRRRIKKGEASSEEPTTPRTGGRLISGCDDRVALRPSHTKKLVRFRLGRRVILIKCGEIQFAAHQTIPAVSVDPIEVSPGEQNVR